mgnify:CR=1 FL=1
MKAQIKEWLTGAGRTRVWLAEQCGVRTKTVQNWLCSQQEIPVRTQNLIRQLMADDARSEAERRADQRADLPGRQGLQSHRLHNICDFCRDAITYRSQEILSGRSDPAMALQAPAPHSHSSPSTAP